MNATTRETTGTRRTSRGGRLAAAALVVALGIVAPPAAATARPAGAPAATSNAVGTGGPTAVAKGLHNARYCEIFEIRGALPEVTVNVWNTVTFSRCPAKWWNSFDATDLAKELGAAAVLFNGPRHFLMDSASAEPGKVRSFHGVKMSKVATIPISSAADLAQKLYTERVIERSNTWSWKRGRTIYELVGPCGTRYVMQSYSQIKDPNLKIGQLASLGERLTLPAGWRFTTRRLTRDTDLKAHGKARIIQDDLTNTYQREPVGWGRAKKPEKHPVDLTATTKTVGSPAPGTLVDEGTFSGDPFGPGTISLTVTLSAGSATGPFKITTSRGTASGRFQMAYTIDVPGNHITFDGTACFSAGTGKFTGIQGSGLRAHDENTLDGQNGTVTLKGSVTY